MDDDATTPAAAPPPPPASQEPRRRWPRRALHWLFDSLLHAHITLLLAVAGTVGTVAWLLATTSGMNAIIALVNRLAPVTIETRGSYGALLREFGFEQLRVKIKQATVSATAVRARIFALSAPPRIDFAELAAASLVVDVTTDPTTPLVREIGAPLRLAFESVTLGSLKVIVDGLAFDLQSLSGRLTAGPDGYRLDGGRVALGVQTAEVVARLGAHWPFALNVNGNVAAQLQDKLVSGAVNAVGSLAEFTVDGALSGAAQGSFRAEVASFEHPAVRSLAVDLTGVDPRLWYPNAPIADLAVKAQLTPSEAMDSVSGTVTVANLAPGRIDADRIPASSATAQVALDSHSLKFERIVAQLPQGSARGEFVIDLPEGGWRARARLADVDPARIHGALRTLRISGELRARRSGDTIDVGADLSHLGTPAASLAFDGRLTSSRATINSARLDLGDGYATAAGGIELSGARRVELQGKLHRFEPGRLFTAVDARLNGSVSVDGVLKPQPAGQMRFELDDSHAFGRPLGGRGRIDIDGERHVDVDIDLAVRSARLSAKGGLGAPGRSLELHANVPIIADLLPASTKTPAAGGFTLDATASGDWTAPALDVHAHSQALRLGDHALDTVEAAASYSGGPDGRLEVRTALAAYRYEPQPKAVVRAASLTIEGRLSQHAIRLQAAGNESLAVTVLADGGFGDAAWTGRVREASVGPPVDLRLLMPATLVVGAGRFEFGPAQLALQGVHFDDVAFRADQAGFATEGRFSDLQPGRFAVPVEGALKPVLPASRERVPLAFRGDWSLRSVQQALDGHVLIERSSGDLYAGRGPESALGLIDARLEARLEANQLNAIVRIESKNKGGLGAHMEAFVEDSADAGWRLAQTRPWLISGAFDLPTMDWINALLSENLRANVRLGGRLESSVRIEGTPAQPSASGRMRGSDLRVAWVEQGVRLENGSLLAHLADGLIILEELRFSGPPRVRPDDHRAATAMKPDEVGKVSANGQLRLRDFGGVIQVAASQLPLLQLPDRWVIASGGANIETSATHVQVNGAFVANAGFVGLARSELPSLSSDVVVVQPGETAESRARRVTLGFDLGVDLGDAFYLRGKGISTRVEGAVRLRSTGKGTVTAVGSINAVDGTYEGFGQKLSIARGRLNFQGPVENPGLDILALRTRLPVQVGVTITRTAADPLVRLYSDPPMSEVEALSWLVLGRPPDQGGSDNIALLQAAAGLLGGAEGYPTRVAKALGFDEISIRSGTIGIASLLPQRGVAGALDSTQSSAATVAGEVITIGKNINDALSVSYQQAITETSRFLQFNYRLSERLSVVARGGTNNALDFVYTISFD